MPSNGQYSSWAVTLVLTIALASCTSNSNQGGASAGLAGSTATAAKIAQLEAEVRHLRDRQQIQDVYARYARGFDRNDVELLKSAFWPEVQLNYGASSETIDEYARDSIAGHNEHYTHYLHPLTNLYIDISGDVAHAEFYLLDMNAKKDGKSFIDVARFVDRLDRRNGEWRVAAREVFFEFMTETEKSIDTYRKEAKTLATSPCGLGTRDKRDPSYLRPLTARSNRDGAACAP